MGIDMSKLKPKQGEMILAKECYPTHSGPLKEYAFLCMEGDVCWGVGKDRSVAVKIESCEPIQHPPEPIPLTHETWPKQVVWLRQRNSECGACFMVVGRYTFGVIHKGSYYSFQQLMEQGWEISLDFCQTWQPCHYVPESE